MGDAHLSMFETRFAIERDAVTLNFVIPIRLFDIRVHDTSNFADTISHQPYLESPTSATVSLALRVPITR